MSIESRPAVYFEMMFAEEIVNYAESYAETMLEKAMLQCMKILIEEIENEHKGIEG